MTKRIGCAAFIAILFAWYFVRCNGEYRAESQALRFTTTDVPIGVDPVVLADRNDPAAVVLAWASGDGFDTLSIDTRTRATQRGHVVAAALTTRFAPYDVAAAARVASSEFHGVDLRRPRPHLFVFPGPGGPGIEWQHSLFGISRVVERGGAQRVLLTRRQVNGDEHPEVFEIVRVDPRGRFIACVHRSAVNEWTLWLFDRVTSSSRMERT